MEILHRQADEFGVPLESLHCSFNPNACYCACGKRGAVRAQNGTANHTSLKTGAVEFDVRAAEPCQ